MVWGRARETDSGWVGSSEFDDLDERLSEEADQFDLTQPHVLTALGPIEPAALGITQVGERLLERSARDLVGAVADPFDAAVAELEDLYAVGVRSVVALDRQSAVKQGELRRLAGRSLLHLVLVGDARAAEGDSPVGALRVWTVGEVDAGVERHRRDALPILLDPTSISDPAAVVRMLTGGGVPPSALTVLGANRLDASVRDALLDQGASLAFAVMMPFIDLQPGANVVADLVRGGASGQIVLGSGLTAAASLRGQGGEPGWAAVAERFVLNAMDAGVDGAAIRAMLVDNPQRQLTINPTAEGDTPR